MKVFFQSGIFPDFLNFTLEKIQDLPGFLVTWNSTIQDFPGRVDIPFLQEKRSEKTGFY